MYAKAHLSEFCPHPLLLGGHRQTIAGMVGSSQWVTDRATQRKVCLDDGDTLVMHDNCPSCWQTGAPIALLLHGLCGSHESPYMQRISAKLNGRGIRTFRISHRGWGSGAGLAKFPMHAGRSEDLRQAFNETQRLCPGSLIALVGFSLGGNVLLKFLAEMTVNFPATLRGAIAVSPPMDLLGCSSHLQKGWTRFYQWYFLRQLMRHVKKGAASIPSWRGRWQQRPKIHTLWEFDDYFTAPLSGFDSANHYYQECSTLHRLSDIHVPTHILSAQDDPLVPCVPSDITKWGETLPCVLQNGGHLGFVARAQSDFDGRWMDWQIEQWVGEFLNVPVSVPLPLPS
ncbi:MAG: alpha/beta fold hydrolase [Planctomycetota bacterium]|nr:alpha/beta fold hydrolase [Planctomycetota bacterium]MDA1178553.1 alpha/beta fold hydrolase [Planctomycetota bacterium]